MKAFISYSTIDKKHGGNVKKALDDIGISSFLAHDDIHVSDQWQRRILSELKSCDIFIPILSKSFKSSDWCSQETGLAFNRKKILIIPLSIDGTNPYGFISHIQGYSWRIDELDKKVLINAIGTKWPDKAVDILLSTTEKVYSYSQAEAAIEPLVPYFKYFSEDHANILAKRAVENGQIWGEHKCRSEYLPEFLRLNAQKLGGPVLRALKYQVENRRWYREEEA